MAKRSVPVAKRYVPMAKQQVPMAQDLSSQLGEPLLGKTKLKIDMDPIARYFGGTSMFKDLGRERALEPMTRYRVMV